MLDVKNLKGQLAKTEEFLKKEFSGIRTGRAHPALVDELEIEAYGSKMKLKEVATITAPEARIVKIEPWDKNQMAIIEKTIQSSDLGMTPVNDGTAIIIRIPDLTTERREEVAKCVSSKLEEARVSARNIREEFLKELTEQNSSGELSDDELEKSKKELQKEIDEFNDCIERLAEKKREEVLSI